MSWKKTGIVAATLLAVGAMFWCSPYWAVSGLAAAARDNDFDLVSDYVDIDELRDDLQSQSRARRQAEIEKNGKTPGDTFGDTFLLDRLIDRFATPRGAAEILSPTLHDLSAPRVSMTVRLMADETVGWRSISAFQMEAGDKMFLIWRRDGFRWRLSGIRFRS